MTDFGMFTNEGNIALAEKLTQALDSLPTGLTTDEQYARFSDLCESDLDFCARHGEWSDTVVREAVYSWLEAPEAMATTEAVGTVDFGATIHITVPTLDGDADAVLEERLEEIREIIRVAIQESLSVIDKRIGRCHEWSGVVVRIV